MKVTQSPPPGPYPTEVSVRNRTGGENGPFKTRRLTDEQCLEKDKREYKNREYENIMIVLKEIRDMLGVIVSERRGKM